MFPCCVILRQIIVICLFLLGFACLVYLLHSMHVQVSLAACDVTVQSDVDYDPDETANYMFKTNGFGCDDVIPIAVHNSGTAAVNVDIRADDTFIGEYTAEEGQTFIFLEAEDGNPGVCVWGGVCGCVCVCVCGWTFVFLEEYDGNPGECVGGGSCLWL